MSYCSSYVQVNSLNYSPFSSFYNRLQKIGKIAQVKKKLWNTNGILYSYLVENNEKATLNFYFKLKFLVKPSKFPIYFAHVVAQKKYKGKDKENYIYQVIR